MNVRHLYPVRNTASRLMAVMMLLCVAFIAFAQGNSQQVIAVYEATANLNLRTVPTTSASIVTTVSKGTKLNVIGYAPNNWAAVSHSNRTVYASRDYMRYLYPVSTQPVQPEQPKATKSFELPDMSSFFSGFWDIIKFILGLLLVITILIFKDQLLEMAIFCAFFTGIGALITYLIFDNGVIGGTIGLCLAVLIIIRTLINYFSIKASWLFYFIHFVVMLPFFLLNRIQYLILEPWRYIFKSKWVADSLINSTRLTLNVVKILLYIVTTPLRLVNAIAYNLIVRFLFGIYDLLFEVLQPSSDDEGAESIGKWLLWMPYRIVVYPVYHGGVLLVEGIIWTIVDIFIPAITMYHGSDLTAAQAIVSCPNRNTYLKNTSKWTNGTFKASQSSWGGIGVYFTPSFLVARSYATDPYRLSDNNPSMIVCRVSLGSIVNYALTPVFYYAGQYGNPSKLNAYAQQHGYTTGEWWNPRGRYWEFCLFDWKNRYNHPWRIRPVYVYNFRTGMVQHIKGGMQHWLFDKSILKDIGSYF